MIDIQLLYEMEQRIRELTDMKKSKTHDRMVADMSLSFGTLMGTLGNGYQDKHALLESQRQIVRLKASAQNVLSGTCTKQVMRKLTQILTNVGRLESQIDHAIEHPRLRERILNIVRMVVLWLPALVPH